MKQFFPVRKRLHFHLKKICKSYDVCLEIYEGETFGLVGESGCGKPILVNFTQLYEQTDGRTMYYGVDVDEIAPAMF